MNLFCILSCCIQTDQFCRPTGWHREESGAMRTNHLTVDFYGSNEVHITTHHIYRTDNGYCRTWLSVCRRVFLLVHIRLISFERGGAVIFNPCSYTSWPLQVERSDADISMIGQFGVGFYPTYFVVKLFRNTTIMNNTFWSLPPVVPSGNHYFRNHIRRLLCPTLRYVSFSYFYTLLTFINI